MSLLIAPILIPAIPHHLITLEQEPSLSANAVANLSHVAVHVFNESKSKTLLNILCNEILAILAEVMIA